MVGYIGVFVSQVPKHAQISESIRTKGRIGMEEGHYAPSNP